MTCHVTYMTRHSFRTMDAMTGWLSDDEQAAWRGLLQMTAHLNARLNRELQEGRGLSLADYEVLVRLSDTAEARLRVYELAQELQWEQSRLSHHLARMQRRGLVAREGCPNDGRGAFIALTDTGRDAIEQAAPGHVDTVRRLVFDGLSPDQVATLTTVTTHVLDRLRATEPAP